MHSDIGKGGVILASILIIDDDEMVRELLAMRLEMQGHDCKQAGDGAAGLERLKEGPLDLIVLDMLMPTMHGLSFLEAAAKAPVAMPPVLVLSATKVETETFPKNLGQIEVLRKPASAARIEESIKAILEAH